MVLLSKRKVLISFIFINFAAEDVMASLDIVTVEVVS